MSFHQCTEMFVQLNVLCFGNWLHALLRKKCGEVLVFSIFHPTRLFRPTQLLIWMNFTPYTIIQHCTAIRHFTVYHITSYHNNRLPTGRLLLLIIQVSFGPVCQRQLPLMLGPGKQCIFNYNVGPYYIVVKSIEFQQTLIQLPTMQYNFFQVDRSI